MFGGAAWGKFLGYLEPSDAPGHKKFTLRWSATLRLYGEGLSAPDPRPSGPNRRAVPASGAGVLLQGDFPPGAPRESVTAEVQFARIFTPQ